MHRQSRFKVLQTVKSDNNKAKDKNYNQSYYKLHSVI